VGPSYPPVEGGTSVIMGRWRRKKILDCFCTEQRRDYGEVSGLRGVQDKFY
jgi:hypothetical protein